MRIFLRLSVIFIVLILLGETLVREVVTLPVQSIPDRELGWLLRPHAVVLQTDEGRATNRMDSMGFNDDDPDPNRNKTHILVLGDSLTEALQVSRQENFTSIAGTMALCLDFYNAGRSGFSPVDYPVVLAKVATFFAPALTVIVVTESDKDDIKKGNFRIVRDSNKHIIDLQLREKTMSGLRVALDPLLSRSALATYLMQRVKALTMENKVTGNYTDSSAATSSRADRDRIHEILDYLFEIMKARTPLAILYIPTMDYSPNRMASIDKQSEDFWNLVEDAAHLSGVPAVSSGAYLEASYSEYGQPGTGFSNNNIIHGHLNKLGHRAIARALVDLLAEAGLRCAGGHAQGN